MIKRTILFTVISIFVFGCSAKESVKLNSFAGSTMGTTYTIKVVSASLLPDSLHSQIQSKIDSVLEEVNRQMSTYIPESEISLFNKSNSTDWDTVSHDFSFVVSKSLQMGQQSDGALNITVGPLVNLWGFGPNFKPHTIPTDDEIESAKSLIGLDKLEVDTISSRIKKEVPGLYVDLSSTAKGFGVDKIAQLIESYNFFDYLVEIGGELKSKGKNQEGKPWKVGISKPDISGNIEKIIELSDLAMATSGDYWNYFEENGIRYSHTIDPRTGKPITHKLASVTVVNESCLMADGYATAINVMGPDSGYAFALKMELPVYMIVREKDRFTTKHTPLFVKYLEN